MGEEGILGPNLNWDFFGHCMTKIYGDTRAILTGGISVGTQTLIANDLDQEWDHETHKDPPDFRMESGQNMQGKLRQCFQPFKIASQLIFMVF